MSLLDLDEASLQLVLAHLKQDEEVRSILHLRGCCRHLRGLVNSECSKLKLSLSDVLMATSGHPATDAFVATPGHSLTQQSIASFITSEGMLSGLSSSMAGMTFRNGNEPLKAHPFNAANGAHSLAQTKAEIQAQAQAQTKAQTQTQTQTQTPAGNGVKSELGSSGTWAASALSQQSLRERGFLRITTLHLHWTEAMPVSLSLLSQQTLQPLSSTVFTLILQGPSVQNLIAWLPMFSRLKTLNLIEENPSMLYADDLLAVSLAGTNPVFGRDSYRDPSTSLALPPSLTSLSVSPCVGSEWLRQVSHLSQLRELAVNRTYGWGYFSALHAQAVLSCLPSVLSLSCVRVNEPDALVILAALTQLTSLHLEMHASKNIMLQQMAEGCAQLNALSALKELRLKHKLGERQPPPSWGNVAWITPLSHLLHLELNSLELSAVSLTHMLSSLPSLHSLSFQQLGIDQRQHSQMAECLAAMSALTRLEMQTGPLRDLDTGGWRGGAANLDKTKLSLQSAVLYALSRPAVALSLGPTLRSLSIGTLLEGMFSWMESLSLLSHLTSLQLTLMHPSLVPSLPSTFSQPAPTIRHLSLVRQRSHPHSQPETQQQGTYLESIGQIGSSGVHGWNGSVGNQVTQRQDAYLKSIGQTGSSGMVGGSGLVANQVTQSVGSDRETGMGPCKLFVSFQKAVVRAKALGALRENLNVVHGAVFERVGVDLEGVEVGSSTVREVMDEIEKLLSPCSHSQVISKPQTLKKREKGPGKTVAGKNDDAAAQLSNVMDRPNGMKSGKGKQKVEVLQASEKDGKKKGGKKDKGVSAKGDKGHTVQEVQGLVGKRGRGKISGHTGQATNMAVASMQSMTRLNRLNSTDNTRSHSIPSSIGAGTSEVGQHEGPIPTASCSGSKGVGTGGHLACASVNAPCSEVQSFSLTFQPDESPCLPRILSALSPLARIKKLSFELSPNHLHTEDVSQHVYRALVRHAVGMRWLRVVEFGRELVRCDGGELAEKCRRVLGESGISLEIQPAPGQVPWC